MTTRIHAERARDSLVRAFRPLQALTYATAICLITLAAADPQHRLIKAAATIVVSLIHAIIS